MTSQPNQIIQMPYHPEMESSLALFVIAVGSDNRVVCVGHVPLRMEDDYWEKKQYLEGIKEQNGFAIISVQN